VSILPNIAPVEDDNLFFERELRLKGYKCVAGVDEVGRGPLAGPVVAACVSLPKNCPATLFLDSKKTTQKQRVTLFELLQEQKSAIGVGIVSHATVDTINILQASLLAMKLATYHHARSFQKPDFILVDGKHEFPIETPQLPLIKGENKSASIAAASIVAKLYRDRLMDYLDKFFPHYNFRNNKGYPTKQHRRAIADYGPSAYHRLTFKGVREFVSKPYNVRK